MNLLRIVSALALWAVALSAGAQTCPAGLPRVAPDSRFSVTEPVPGQPVVTDLATGLMWKRSNEVCPPDICPINPHRFPWRTALRFARESTHAGFSDWRLPSATELYSLMETGCLPTINVNVFGPLFTDRLWTSTTWQPVQSWAHIVRVNDGSLYAGSKSLDLMGQGEAGALLVRGGPGLAAFDSAEFLLRNGFE